MPPKEYLGSRIHAECLHTRFLTACRGGNPSHTHRYPHTTLRLREKAVKGFYPKKAGRDYHGNKYALKSLVMLGFRYILMYMYQVFS